MTERPILFSSEMVKAILAGRKTQTRRGVKGEALLWLKSEFTPGFVADPANNLCPLGNVGDRLWVRETFAINHNAFVTGPLPQMKPDFHGLQPTDEPILYRAEGEFHEQFEQAEDGRWRPSIHMPRWASRITLEITNIRIEGIKEILDADAISEGIQPMPEGGWKFYGQGFSATSSPRDSFQSLWESIYGQTSWQRNVPVWVLEFRRIQ